MNSSLMHLTPALSSQNTHMLCHLCKPSLKIHFLCEAFDFTPHVLTEHQFTTVVFGISYTE